MAKYLETTVLAELDEYRRKIFELRAEAYAKTKIDVLDNDTLSALSIYEIVHQYDPFYNVNFSRNGEDGKSKGVLIEQKASRVEKKKKSGLYATAGFQFHAMGNLKYDRYIFATRDRSTLNLIKIYDISIKENIELVQSHLFSEREKWLERGRKDQAKMKRDVIIMPEDLLIKNLTGIKKKTFNNCEVIIA